jgi:hypothetical protein
MTPEERRKAERRSKDLRDIGIAAGAVAGAVYGRGVAQAAGRARVLRAMSKPGNKIAHHANDPNVSWNTHRDAYKAMFPTVNRWVNTFSGAGKIRAEEARGAKTGAARIMLRPYRARNAYDAKILGRAVDAAPERTRLYRGIAVKPGTAARPMPGLTSWSSSPMTAGAFAGSASRHGSKGRLSAISRNTTKGATEPVVLEARNQRGFRLAPFSDRLHGHDAEIEFLVKPGTNFRRI